MIIIIPTCKVANYLLFSIIETHSKIIIPYLTPYLIFIYFPMLFFVFLQSNNKNII
ncbi:hypothetical protein XIS1_1270036 [Xenorhabdus innexi]|uniref:Uncharacterized protein n=1 Tax=Xenorhabdus innexi TaxID=290109 RepID=A0A1N6MSV1_9GAMM|nr:hypothetical protein XIS1_1270036 [Xenorhabdus innexi]